VHLFLPPSQPHASAVPRRRPFAYALALALGLMLMMGERVALACPDCPTAVSARQRVFGEDFFANLGMVSLPLVVLGGICALLWRVGRSELPRRNRPARLPGTERSDPAS
jgi:hypothetical protein